MVDIVLFEGMSESDTKYTAHNLLTLDSMVIGPYPWLIAVILLFVALYVEFLKFAVALPFSIFVTW